jgi:hypothetical protein
MAKAVVFKWLSNIGGEREMRKKYVGNYMDEIHAWNKQYKSKY